MAKRFGSGAWWLQVLVIFLLVFCCAGLYGKPVSAAGTTYYVDSAGGSDSNNGTSSSSPWQSLSKVNATTFSPGDQILLKAGAIWSGQLAPQGSGSSGSPITIGMYGTGNKPIINGGGIANGTIYLHNQEYWTIRDMEITNTAPSLGLYYGIYVSASDFGEAHEIVIENNDIHDVSGQTTTNNAAPIVVYSGGSTTPTYFNGVTVTNNVIHDSSYRTFFLNSTWENRVLDPGHTGVTKGNGPWTPSINVVYSNNTIYNMQGDSGIIHVADNPIISHNVIHDSNKTKGTGYWVFNADNAIFEFNESYNGTPGITDGYGFDIDWMQQGTIVQYNYSHNNPFGFIELDANSSTRGYTTINPIVRYNISQNDGYEGTANNAKSIYVTGGVKNAMIYNNTIYGDASISPYAVKFWDWGGNWPVNTVIKNNIFYYNGSPSWYMGSVTGVDWDHNSYHGISAPSGDAHPVTAVPKLLNPGTGQNGLDTVYGYMLQSDSPLIGGGVHIDDNGLRDFWGYPVSATGAPNIGAYDGPGVAWTKVDDSDGALTYSGSGWTQSGVTGDYDGTVMQSNTAGDIASYTFTGTGARVAMRKGGWGGKVDVYLDGQLVLNDYDTYAPSQTYQQLIYEKTHLDYGSHTIELHITGTKNSSSNGYLGMLDYIEYQKFPVEWKNVNDTSWLVNYTGDWSVVRYLADDAATVTESNVAGNTASFTFNGFAVGVFMQEGAWDGIVDIHLDGVKVATCDTYNATRLEHQLVYQNNSIGSGSHTIEVHVTGTKNASSNGYLGILDSFEYK